MCNHFPQFKVDRRRPPIVWLQHIYPRRATCVSIQAVCTRISNPDLRMKHRTTILFFYRSMFPTVRTFQGGRAAGCQEECAICADDSFPCQSCFNGNPSATVCDDPSSYIFLDTIHLTAEFHEIVAESVRECSEDRPDYDRPWVEVLCPEDH